MGKNEKLQKDDNIFGVVREIWKEVLNVETIKREDSFFDLNGNSLHAMIMLEALKQRLHVEVVIQQVYEHETLGEFTEYVESLQNTYDIYVKAHVDADIASYDKRISSKEIVNSIRRYDANAKAPVEKQYKMLKFQRYFIYMGQTNYLSILANVIKVKGCKSDSVLLEAVRELIQEQAVLRTGISNDGKYMLEYSCDNWDIEIIDMQERQEEWNSFVKELSYIRNERDAFGEGKLLSKIFILKRSQGEYEVRVFIHHSVWDRMSHIIIENRLNAIINKLQDDEIPVQPYLTYIQKNKITIGDKLHCLPLMATGFFPKVLKYGKKVKNKKCFDFTICYEPSEQFLEQFKENPIWNNIDMFCRVLTELNITIESLPFVVLSNDRLRENSKTIGMFINIVFASYQLTQKKMTNILKKGAEFGRENSSKLYFEMNNAYTMEKASKIVPIVNYVGLYPGYENAEHEFMKVEEVDISKPFENRITSFVSDNHIYISFKMYADTRDRAIDAVCKIFEVDKALLDKEEA